MLSTLLALCEISKTPNEHPLKTNGRLANLELTFLVTEATCVVVVDVIVVNLQKSLNK